jgi:hypothetical protein
MPSLPFLECAKLFCLACSSYFLPKGHTVHPLLLLLSLLLPYLVAYSTPACSFSTSLFREIPKEVYNNLDTGSQDEKWWEVICSLHYQLLLCAIPGYEQHN